jgi:imidazolonepropionase-like amidohydrolase
MHSDSAPVRGAAVVRRGTGAWRAVAVAAALAAVACCAAAAVWAAEAAGAPPPFVVRGARVFDGTAMIGESDVLVRDGKIAAVGKNLQIPAGVAVVDGRGKTLLPGLIDAHVHVFGDALKQALLFGVTTELDMFTDAKMAADIKAEQAAGRDLDMADLRSAGTLVTAPGGHGTEYGIKIPTINGPEEAQAFVDARIAEGSDYIKIIYDDGRYLGLSIPTISKATLQAVVAAAHRRGKMVTVHIGTLAGARDAIEAGADGLAHLFVDQMPDPGFGRFVAEHHAFVAPTLDVLQGIAGVGAAGADALREDPHVAPYLAANAAASLAARFPVRKGAPALHYEAAVAAVRQLQAAGVPILAGTDAPNPGTAHGASLHRELQLLVEAGLTPAAALTAATAAPAAAFRLSDRGRIAPGLRADLLLVNGDPTVDILATRDVAAIWKVGVRVDREAARAALESAKAAVAAEVGGDGRVSDFDDGTTKAAFGSGWTVSTDSIAGGKSTADLKVVPGSATSSRGGSLAVSGTVAPGLAYAWAGAMFSPGPAPMAPVNLSSRKAIHFWAKGDGKTYRLMIFTESSGMIPLTQTFVAGAEWKELVVPFKAFGDVTGKGLLAVLWVGGPAPGDFAFQIDDVSFQ